MQLLWNQPGERNFETGLDRGVLYVDGLDGVAWPGLVNVTESPEGGAARPYYLDGVKYLNLTEGEEFAGSISAFYSPAEFDLCDGTIALRPGLFANHQVRRPFCFSFRSRIGNDFESTEFGYKIHLVYNAMAQPTTRSYSSISDNSDINNLTWRITTRSIPFPELSPTAHITIDSTKIDAGSLAALEAILYGSVLDDARIPMPEELLAIVSSSYLIIIDHGDGTFTASGPDDVVIDNFDGTFTIISPNVIDNGDGTFVATGTNS